MIAGTNRMIRGILRRVHYHQRDLDDLTIGSNRDISSKNSVSLGAKAAGKHRYRRQRSIYILGVLFRSFF
jgi:hypothetical protein